MARVWLDTTTCPIPGVKDRPRTRVPFGLVQIHPRAPDDTPRVWKLARAAKIGRSADCAVTLDDGTASRVHAELAPTATGATVVDARSRHGTFLNGQPLASSPAVAGPGSVLRCGDTLLMLVRDPSRYESPPRRLSSDFTGMPRDVLAGPDTWRAWQEATQAGPLEHPVLILGESGTGKEVLARLVHLSRPTPGKFVALNLSAIPDGLFEAELFGHTRGAFTGAAMARQGAFREAVGGTLFLDELGELRTDLQVKLLRSLETKSVRPLGTDGDVPADPRLVAATSRDLDAWIEAGKFRRDLYYRLSGIVIRLPPLRERRDEILLLTADHLAKEAKGVSLSAAAAERLVLRHWAGNVRELHHAILRALLRLATEGGTEILPHHLPEPSEPPRPPEVKLTAESIRAAMERSGGNATAAAKLLGVSRATLYNYCTRNRLDLSLLRNEPRNRDGARRTP